MKTNVFVIRLGNNLYAESKYYIYYPSTTRDILHAYFYDDYTVAQRAAKKLGGEAVELTITDENNSDYEMLQAANLQLIKERDAALNELNLYKLKETKDK